MRLAPLLLALVLAAPARAQQPLLPLADRVPLRDLIEEVVEAGLTDEVRRLTELLESVGEPALELSPSRLRWVGAALKNESKSVSRAKLRHLAKVAYELAATWEPRLIDVAPQDREPLARAILALDDENARAHTMLGHTLEAGGWATDQTLRIAELGRRRRAAREQADEVEVTFEVDRSESEALLAFAKGAIQVRAGGLLVHSDRPAQEVEAALTQVVRAFQYSRYLSSGSLTPVRENTICEVIWLANPGQFGPFARSLVERGELGEHSLELVATGVDHLFDNQRRVFGGWPTTPSFQSCLLLQLWRKDVGTNVQPSLTAGHLNGVCLDFWGAPCPPIFATFGGAGAQTRSPDEAREGIADAKAVWRILKTSLPESREFLAALARKGSDPPWSDSMEPAEGVIVENDLLKSTWVVQYLIEQGRFQSLLKQTRSGQRGKHVFAKALGKPLDQFEKEWRAWFLEEPQGFAQRLERRM